MAAFLYFSRSRRDLEFMQFTVSTRISIKIVGQASLPVIDARASLARATFLKTVSGASNKMLARHRQALGVEITVARDPLHGSGPAELPHPALASGNDAQAAQRIGMVDTGLG